jgi:DNA repair protein RecN (Recombination protein N)
MLRFLHIRNLAVIEEVQVEFGPGLTVLTGETGAGKSILVEAVGLLLGGRASSELVRTGEDAAHIEAIFEASDGREVIVRREITAQGRSRAFIDGMLATATALRELSVQLVELHGQHEHHLLLENDRHLDLLDDFGELQPLREVAAAAFDEMQRRRAALDGLRMDDRQKAARIDLLTFQRDEIERAALRAGEDEELTVERLVLANADKLQRLAAEAYAALYDSDGAALASLGVVWRRVGELAATDPRAAPYVEAREGIKSQLEDLAFFLREYVDGIDASPARLQAVEDRLASIARLKRKYGESVAEILDHGRRCRSELDALSELESRAAAAEGEYEAARTTFVSAAEALSRRRRDSAPRLAQQLERQLGELAMGGTRFQVRLNDTPLPEAQWSGRGTDHAEFFVSANVGEELRPLARIASGGELSRIMLALRGLTMDASGHRTLVFDEVDAGIGGRAADDVGRKLRDLSSSAQVLCITHLPQIAAQADAQLQVRKSVRDGRTVTSVIALDASARCEEIARMMAGGTITPTVLASAADMLASRYQPQAGNASTAPEGPARGVVGAKGESKTKAKAKVRG